MIKFCKTVLVNLIAQSYNRRIFLRNEISQIATERIRKFFFIEWMKKQTRKLSTRKL